MRFLTKGLTALFVLTMLISAVQAQWWEKTSPPTIHNKTMPEKWWDAAKEAAMYHKSDPFRVAAVMWLEMGSWKTGKAGKGRNGRKYVGPCGFNKHCNIPEEVIYTPTLQIKWAVGRLKGDFVRKLKTYNTKWFVNNYIRDVVNLKNKIEKEARCQFHRETRFSGPYSKELDKTETLFLSAQTWEHLR